MSLRTIGSQTKRPVVWLPDSTNGNKLGKDHGVIYLRKVADPQTGQVSYKLGQVTRDSAEGLTAVEAFEKRYTSRSGEGGDIIAEYLIVFDKKFGKDFPYDDKIRMEANRLKKAKVISFDGLYPGYQMEGYNEESLPNFADDHFDTLLVEVIMPTLGYSKKRDTREPWTPRDAGTIASQELMVGELTSVLKTYDRGAFAGYTGVGKSHIGIATAHRILESANAHIKCGGLVLITTPIVDTAQDFEDAIAKYRYGNNRDLPVSLYRQDSVDEGVIVEFRARADAGELIFLLLTVQDVRYKEEQSNGIRVKYEDLLNVVVDVWIRDEFHKEYGGTETTKVVSKLQSNTTYLVDLSATLRKAIEQQTYQIEQIVNRDFFWALENRQYMSEDPVPLVMIKLLGDISHNNLPIEMREMYNPSEGWNHGKMVERTLSGGLKQYAGFKGMLVRAYCLEDDFEENPYTINNHPDLYGDESKKVGLWRYPHGADGTSAEDIYVPLAQQLRVEKEFVNAGVYITSSWEISDSLPFRNPDNQTEQFKTAAEYVEYLKAKYNYVVIITQTKYCTGSNIPSLGHEVLCDNISNPDTMEQFFPGRVFRRYPGKNVVALFLIAPGVTLKNNIHAMAANARRANPNKDMTDYLRQIQISKYDSSWTDITAEEMFDEFQSNLRNGIRSELNVTELLNIIRGNDVTGMGTLDLGKNKAEQKKKELTPDNGSEKRRPGDPESGDDEAEDTNEDNTNSSNESEEDNAVLWAQSINAVMVEVPAFAVPQKILFIEDAVNHRMIRLMFGDANIDLLVRVMNRTPALKQRLQDKLTEWHNANQNLPPAEIYDTVFKNTERKKKQGLVFLKMDLARELVKQYA